MRTFLSPLRSFIFLTVLGLACVSPIAQAQSGGDKQPKAPTVSRRIITKVDGVVVEDRDASQAAGKPSLPPPEAPPANTNYGPWLYQPQGEPVSTTPSTSAQPQVASLGESPQSDVDEEQTSAEDRADQSLADNLSDQPTERNTHSGTLRFSKRRGIRIRHESLSTESPEFPEDTIAQSSTDEATHAEQQAEEPPQPSKRLVLGDIVSVNPDNGTAVVWLNAHYLVFHGEAITRNHEMEQTSILRPTTVRGGRALGVEIVSGQPRLGDEVVYTTSQPSDFP